MNSIKFIYLIILLGFQIKLLDAIDIDSKLTDYKFITRTLVKTNEYSFSLIACFDIRETSPNFDFSYKSQLLKAGRLKKQGYWREIENPLSYSVKSNIFKELNILGNDFSMNTTGTNGIGLWVLEPVLLNIFFSENLWLSANCFFDLDPAFISVFIAGSDNKISISNDWASLYPFPTKSNPVHIGVNLKVKNNSLNIDYLGVMSGSHGYQKGFYNRLMFEIPGEILNIKSLFGLTNPSFLDSGGSLAKNMYLTNLWIGFFPFKNWSIELELEYKESHKPVVPPEFIPSSGSSFLRTKFNNSLLLLDIKFNQKFSFDFYGELAVDNSFQTRLGLLGQFSLFFDYNFSFNFNSLTEKKVELELKGRAGDTNIDLIFQYKEEIFVLVDVYKFNVRIEQEFPKGNIFCSIGLGNELLLDSFTLGINTNIE
jgi:hypothetical protein